MIQEEILEYDDTNNVDIEPFIAQCFYNIPVTQKLDYNIVLTGHFYINYLIYFPNLLDEIFQYVNFFQDI